MVGQYHTLLQKRRREQNTSLFVERMKIRNGIEGTQSELVRAHGLRRARYRGKAKVDLQNQFIGAACNIKRWLRWLARQMKGKAPENSPPKVVAVSNWHFADSVSTFALFARTRSLSFRVNQSVPWQAALSATSFNYQTAAQNRGFFSGIKCLDLTPISISVCERRM